MKIFFLLTILLISSIIYFNYNINVINIDNNVNVLEKEKNIDFSFSTKEASIKEKKEYRSILKSPILDEDKTIILWNKIYENPDLIQEMIGNIGNLKPHIIIDELLELSINTSLRNRMDFNILIRGALNTVEIENKHILKEKIKNFTFNMLNKGNLHESDFFAYLELYRLTGTSEGFFNLYSELREKKLSIEKEVTLMSEFIKSDTNGIHTNDFLKEINNSLLDDNIKNNLIYDAVSNSNNISNEVLSDLSLKYESYTSEDGGYSDDDLNMWLTLQKKQYGEDESNIIFFKKHELSPSILINTILDGDIKNIVNIDNKTLAIESLYDMYLETKKNSPDSTFFSNLFKEIHKNNDSLKEKYPID